MVLEKIGQAAVEIVGINAAHAVNVESGAAIACSVTPRILFSDVDE
jgi:hypothetical protein